MDAREVALLTLSACELQGGWSDGALKKQLAVAKLDSRDAGLATNLCFGVLQNRMLLDFYLGHFSNIPLKRMESKVVQALRLGVYQMLFLDKIPHRAAVDCSVNMTKTHCKNKRASGMVNGILRSVERNLDKLPVISGEDRISYLSTLYSHPQWLVEELMNNLGEEETAKLLHAHNEQPPMTAMVNTVKISQEMLLQRLEEEKVKAEVHPWLPNCLLLQNTGNLEQLPAFREGLFYIQDVASRLAIWAANPQAGQRVLDVCAAPGGKSFATAIAMNNQGSLTSCDLHPHKKNLLEKGAERLGLSILTAETADGKVCREEWKGQFDLVIVDAPCSGLGVIRKKPDIRYKDPVPLAELPAIQHDILENACGYVAPGGTLLYSTCTILKRENQDIVDGFLKNHPEFTITPFSLPEIGTVETGMQTLWPHRHGTDGFFIAKLTREGRK